MKITERILAFALAACLVAGSVLTASASQQTENQGGQQSLLELLDAAAEASGDGEEEAAETKTDSGDSKENGEADVSAADTEDTAAERGTKASAKSSAASASAEASVSAGGETSPSAEKTTREDTEPEENENQNGNHENTDNTDITVTPSDANALVLMDAGAQSPRGVPGQEVEVWLTLAVNREYLPSENYVLRNITVSLDIPTSSTQETWPFDVVNASYVKHLDDMTYNSTADVRYKLRISEFAKEGVYAVNFTVSATIWREDSVNGTAITEDVEFPMNVFVTVVENGNMSGVTSAIGPLELAGREDTAIASPTGRPGETIVLSVPIVNKGMTLTNVTVTPVVTGDLETFPFVTQDINYGRELGTMENGNRQTVDWILTISPYATTGNKVVTIRATYEENGVYGECTLNAYVYVKDGYVQSSAPSLTVEGYTLLKGEETVEYVEAGTDAVLRATIKNNSSKDAVYKTVATLKLSDSNSLILSSGYTDVAYVDSISPGKTAEIEYHITARATASVGPSQASISFTYENRDVTQGSAAATLQIPVRQPMNLQIDTPVVYGSAAQGEPVSVSLHLTNLGRSRAYNVTILAMDGITMQDTWFGGDILAAGSMDADLEVIPNRAGDFTGTLAIQYEDADGELYTQNAALELSVQEAQETDPAAELIPEEEEKEQSGINPWLIAGIAAAALVLAGAAALYCLRVIRRKKQDEIKQEGADREKL